MSDQEGASGPMPDAAASDPLAVRAQRMETIGQLAAGVEHELNNPLASVVAFSQLLRSDPALTEDLRRQADLLAGEAKRIKTIVGDLLDFSRERPTDRPEVDLRGVVDGVMRLLAFTLRRSRVTVESDIPTDLPRLAIDRSALQQVLVNLTLAAAQGSAGGDHQATVRIVATTDEGESLRRVRIAITTDEPGAASTPADDRSNRAWSVSRAIVATHGGTLLSEADGSGATMIVIELPAATADGAPGPTTPIPAPARAAAPERKAGRTTRVLVLDDEPSIRDFLGRVLTRDGHEAVLVASGAEALELIRAEPPDAILCDHRMAGMTGTEFHAAVSAIDPALGGRFAFMSGDVLNAELRRFATDNGVRLLAKPFDIATVGEMVRTLLDGRGAGEA